MDRRAITFILLSSMVLLTWIVLEPIFNPPQAPPNRLAQEGDDPTDPTTPNSEDAPSETTSGDGSAGDGTTGQAPGDGDPANAQDTGSEAIEFAPESAVVGLGSLASGSPYRMLVTLDSRGGTVRRIELADRLPSGEFRFKHVDDRAGYLGNLEVESAVEGGGAVVRFVGQGTPAQLATGSDGSTGLVVGDVIESVNDQPVVDAGDYFAKLGQSKPGDSLKLGVQRGESSIAFTAQLLSRPMEVIQPFPEGTSDTSRWHHPSFSTRVGGWVNGVFRASSVNLATADWQLGEPKPREAQVADAAESADQPADTGSTTEAPATQPLESADPDVVTFHYVLTDKDLEGTKLQGPLTLIKRYRIARREKVTEPTRWPEFDRTYHLDLHFELRNETDQPQRIAVQFGGPTGLPEEGWWYLNKIHGRSTALFYTAGTRDVVGSSAGLGFRFLGGPEIVSTALTEGAPPLELFPQAYDELDRTVKFAAVDTQYFSVAMIPQTEQGKPPFVCFAGSADTVQEADDIDRKQRRRADVSFQLQTLPIEVAPYRSVTISGADSPESAAEGTASSANNAANFSFTIFAGPKFPRLLENYELSEVVSYGWFALFSKPLVGILHLFYLVVGNYGIAIIMLTVVVRAAMIPISRKAAMNAQMMQHLQPEMKKIAEQYKTDMEKRARAQQDLFRKYNYNPMGGCLLMFIQLPIFLGLYRGLSVDIELRDQGFIPGVAWCSNLAGPDRLFDWGNWMPFLTSETGWLGPYFNVLPIITIVLFLIQQKMFMPPALDEQQQATQRMMTFMMVFMGLMFFKVPSGLCIYFITSSLWGIVERKLLPKPSIDGKIAAIEAGPTVVEDANREKSAGQARLEEERRRRQVKKKGDDKKK